VTAGTVFFYKTNATTGRWSGDLEIPATLELARRDEHSACIELKSHGELLGRVIHTLPHANNVDVAPPGSGTLTFTLATGETFQAWREDRRSVVDGNDVSVSILRTLELPVPLSIRVARGELSVTSKLCVILEPPGR
jgi:hypothetical protein